MRRVRGFTILEVLVASLLFGLLSTTLFQAFRFGALSFQRAATRQDAQSALRMAYFSLRDDLRKSHFHTVSLLARNFQIEGRELRRDALVFGGLKDWNSTESFDAVNGLPKWDRYILYYGTRSGLLVRAHIDPDRPDFSPNPFPELEPELYLREDPSLNRGYQSGFRTLSRDLLSFECSTEPATDQVQVRCLLQNASARKSEVSLTVYPQNTWPRGEQR